MPRVPEPPVNDVFVKRESMFAELQLSVNTASVAPGATLKLAVV